jgi:hypothetical protein
MWVSNTLEAGFYPCPPYGHGVDKTAKKGSVLVTQAKKTEKLSD